MSARDRRALENDWGFAEITPRRNIRAGRTGTWEIIYRAGRHGIPVGGSLRIVPPHQGNVIWDMGKVSAYAERPGLFLEVMTENEHPRTYHHSNYPAITVIVYGRGVEPGEIIRVVMGETGGYTSGRFLHARAQDHAAELPFAVSVDPVGNTRFAVERQVAGRYRPVSGELTVQVVADTPHRFRVSLRHPPASGQPAKAVLVVEDRHENVVRDFAGTLEFRATPPVSDLPASLSLTADDHGRASFTFPCPVLEEPLYLTAFDAAHELIGTSNPLQPGFHGDYNAYFGDLHVMTGQGHVPLSGMLGDTQEAILYARDDRGLDFTAVTNSGRTWETDRELFARHNAPHEFVTMPACERGFRTGHKNIYLLDESDEPPTARDVPELWEALEGKQAMVISHHTNTHSETDRYAAWGPQDLSTIDPRWERLIEICQNRGSFERDEVGSEGVHFGGFGSSVQDALARGLRLGFVGGTDNHRARPASKRSNQSGLDADEFLTGGITCILAQELTREALWEALWDRRCYAATSVRILLDFRVNGELMGREIDCSDPAQRGPRRIAVRAAGTADIERAVIVRNGLDVHTAPGDGRLLQFEWVDETPLEDVLTPDGQWVYYYVRLVQRDGNMAWASPVWLR